MLSERSTVFRLEYICITKLPPNIVPVVTTKYKTVWVTTWDMDNMDIMEVDIMGVDTMVGIMEDIIIIITITMEDIMEDIITITMEDITTITMEDKWETLFM